MLPFFVVIAVLTLALPPAVGFAFSEGWLPHLPSFLRETTWLMALVTSIIFVYLYRKARPTLFVQLYLLSMVVKLLACFAYSLLMILEDRGGAVANVVYFLIVYSVYTAVEIGFLYGRISRPTRP